MKQLPFKWLSKKFFVPSSQISALESLINLATLERLKGQCKPATFREINFINLIFGILYIYSPPKEDFPHFQSYYMIQLDFLLPFPLIFFIYSVIFFCLAFSKVFIITLLALYSTKSLKENPQVYLIFSCLNLCVSNLKSQCFCKVICARSGNRSTSVPLSLTFTVA